jgi:WD40 repeat protein
MEEEAAAGAKRKTPHESTEVTKSTASSAVTSSKTGLSTGCEPMKPSESGVYALTMAKTGKLQIWDGLSRTLIWSIKHTGDPSPICALNLVSNRLVCACHRKPGSILVWDLSSGLQMHEISDSEFSAKVWNRVVMNNAGTRFLIFVMADQGAHSVPATVWDVESGVKLFTINMAYNSVCFGADNALIVLDIRGRFHVFDAAGVKLATFEGAFGSTPGERCAVCETLVAGATGTHCLAFTENFAGVWDYSSGTRKIDKWVRGNCFKASCFGPNDESVVLMDDYGLAVWSIATSELLLSINGSFGSYLRFNALNNTFVMVRSLNEESYQDYVICEYSASTGVAGATSPVYQDWIRFIFCVGSARP